MDTFYEVGTHFHVKFSSWILFYEVMGTSDGYLLCTNGNFLLFLLNKEKKKWRRVSIRSKVLIT